MLYLPFKQNSSVLLYHVSIFDTFIWQIRHKAIHPWQLAGSLASYVTSLWCIQYLKGALPKVGINSYFEAYKFYQIGPWSKSLFEPNAVIWLNSQQ